MSVYETNAFLYGYDALIGKSARMEYLPTARSRKWRTGFFVKSYSEVAWTAAMRLVQLGEVSSFRFVAA